MKKKFFIKDYNFKLLSKKSIRLKKREIKEICSLKMENWSYSFTSQFNWFKNNINEEDIHNLLYFKNSIIGYTCLRKKLLFYKSLTKNFLLFDTLIIKKEFHKKNLGNILMNFNNKIIKKNNLPSYLLAKKRVINFYQKHRWRVIKKNYQFLNHEFSRKDLMYFNCRKINEKIFFII